MATKKKSKKAAAGKKAAAPKKKVTVKKAKSKLPSLSLLKPKTYKVYIESTAFFPINSSDGYVDHFQNGRSTAVPDKSLATPIVLPVGSKLLSMKIHYTNTTANTPLAFFLRKHADRHSPSGEIEMSFINLPNTSNPPDNYLTVEDTSFSNGNIIQDKFLHYLEIPNTGDFGSNGRVTVRGVSLVYKF